MTDGWRQPDELLGRVLGGRYRVDRIAGKGGMGTVFEAVHTHIEKRVAVKILAPAMAHDESNRARFLNEARAAARISSPHVVSITDYGLHPLTFVVMEFLEGEDLARRLARTGPASPSQVLHWLRQICAGLEAAHKKGVVHRDIKPSNIFLAKDEDGKEEVVKILDFGIAKLFDADPTAKGITRPNEAVGTATYMAPEQVLGADVDPRTDLYSLGVVLYRVLSGTIPFRAENSFRLMEKHVRVAPPPLNIGAPGVESVVLRCLKKAPEDRYPDAGALLRDFERAVQRGDSSRSGRTLVSAPRVPTLVAVPPRVQAAETSTEPVLGTRADVLPLVDEATFADEGTPAAGQDPSRSHGRVGRVTVPLVLLCSMLVGGVASAWHLAGEGHVSASDELRASAAVAPASEPLPPAEAEVSRDDPAAPQEVASVEDDPPLTSALDVPEPTVQEDADVSDAADPKPPPTKPLTTARAHAVRHKRTKKARDPRPAPPTEPSVVGQAMLDDARKAALTDHGLCYRLAKEAHAMDRLQDAAVVMTKCACLLGDTAKVEAAAKLLRGEHPKLERLCELKGVELVLN
jgi:serine/threonine-protein kinase